MWLVSLRRLVAGNSHSRKERRRLAARKRKPIGPTLESLEERLTPSGGQTAGSYSALTAAIAADTASNTNYVIQITNNFTFASGGQVSISKLGAGSTLTIEGQNGANYTLTGNGNRLFDIAKGQTVSLENLTLTGGMVSGTAAKGGAVYNSGNLSMKSVIVAGNQAIGGSGQNAAGGGIYSNGGSLTLVNDLIGREVEKSYKHTTNPTTSPPTTKQSHSTKTVGVANQAAAGTGGSSQGGGLYLAGGTVNVSNCTIGGNQLSGGASAQGGGIYANGVTTLNLTKDIIGRDSVQKYTFTSTEQVQSSNTIGSANKATGGSAMGAGLYVSGGTVNVSQGAIAGNQADAGAGQNAAGGGVYSVGASLTFNTVALNNNHAFGGVASAAIGSSGGNALGGGLFLSGGQASLTNSQVTGNIGGHSSALLSGGGGGVSGNGGNAQGGGIYALNTTLTVTGSSHVDRNQIAGGEGGNGTAHHLAGGQGGNAQGGGVYASASTIVLSNGSTLNNNFAEGGDGGKGGNGLSSRKGATSKRSGGTAGGQGGNGGLGQGGGLFANGGSVTVASANNAANNISIIFNEAQGGLGGAGGQGGVGVKLGQVGGVGGAGGAGGEGDGGGIYINAAPLTVSGGVTFATNGAIGGVGGQGGQGGTSFGQNIGTRGTVKSSYGGNGGNGGSGGNGGAAQGGGLFAAGSGLAISLGDAAGGLAMRSNQANAGHGAGGGAGGKVGYTFVNGVLQTPKYIMGQGGQSGNGGAAKGGGAAIFGDKLTLTNADIQTNYVQGGGGGFNKGYDFSTPEGISIGVGGAGGAAGGAGGSGQGGGLFVSASSAVLLNSTLANNSANYDGYYYGDGNNGGNGGNGGKRSMLSRYSYGLGYGMHGGSGGAGGTNQGAGLYASSSSLSVLNSTIADNALYDSLEGAGGTGTQGNGAAGVNGSSQGGGVFATGGSLSLTNDTIAWNFINPTVSTTPSGDQGAGIFASNTPTLQNTIVALDRIYNSVPATPTSTPSDLYGAASASSDNNLIGTDPLFAAPAPAGPGQGQEPGNYGGLTPTLPLYGTSPAIAVGNPAATSIIATAEGVASNLATDQRGLPRLVNGAIDIGATEMQVEFTGTPSVTTVQAGGTITYTVTVTNGEGVPITGSLSDLVPTNTTYVSGSASGTGWTITEPSATNSNTLTATATVNPGATATLTFSVTVASGASGTITDTADLRWTGTNTSGTLSVPMNTTVTSGMSSTTTTLTSSGNPSVYGQPVTFTATVSNGSSSTPAGNVVFEEDNTIVDKVALSNGVATFTPSTLSVGSHNITAIYCSDTNDYGSTSNTVSQVVDKDKTTTTLDSSIIPSVYGQNVTFTATVSVTGLGSGTPTGTVTFYDGTTKLGTGTFSGGAATFSTSALSVNNHSITAVYGGDGNDLCSSSNSVIQAVDKDSTTTTLSPSAGPSVYGQTVTFTATVKPVSPGAGTPTGTVTFYDNGNPLGTGTLSGGVATLTTSTLPGGSDSITASYGGDTNDLGSTTGSALSQMVNPAQTTTSLSSSLTTSPLGQNVTFTATVGVVSPGSGTPAGSVEFVDTTTGNVLGTVPLSPSGTASLPVSSLVTGSNAIEAIYSGQSGDFLGSTSSSLTETITQSIVVLNSTASGSLKLSGNTSINVPGNVIVDSSSASALTESGNAGIKAASIQVVGGVSTSGTATLSPAAVTGIAPVANPLACLTGPSASGLTNYGAVCCNTGSHTLNPGIYSSIRASGNACLTLNPGIYIIEGGGVTVTGGASIAGSGVMIYNTSSNYPSSTGSYGGITLSGKGSFSLTAPTSGQYAGVVLFQPSANTRAISLSGNAAAGLTGTIYAPAALLYASGNASVNAALVVNELTLSGNAASTQSAAGADADNADGTAGQLLAGDVEVYVNNSNGDLTSDELARIQDAVNAVNAVVSPYGVTVAEVSDSTQANVTLSMGTTSAAGNYGQGVLGCYTLSGQITLIQGWNWYAGADPSQIGANQYDFETTVTHELGHALGLGHSSDPISAMYATLAPATAIRTLTTVDLGIPYAAAGADAQMAAVPPVSTIAGTAAGNSAASGQDTTPPLSTSSPSTSNPLSVVDQLFADVSLVLSDLRSAYQSQLSSVSALWQQADELALQRLDALLSLEADAWFSVFGFRFSEMN
jgi:uncharacterized repeat protein (TIGR01451 family)